MTVICAKDIVRCMLIVSEKAARVARICRQDDHLLSLLIEEKKENEKNSRFLNDFKTLADVLVQELIKYDISKQFPELKNYLYGEENNVFTNAIGESVTIILNDSVENTVFLLSKVLDGDDKAAKLLAETVHSDVSLADIVPSIDIPSDDVLINVHELALWIDPIDSTAEYINGICNESEAYFSNGLNCVTVLIGAFNRSTGSPMIGVVNQPFYSIRNNNWRGRIFWGVSAGDNHFSTNFDSLFTPRNELFVAISSCERDEIKRKLKAADFKLISPAGAGYKILCVAMGAVDAYVLSQATTYFWDTCACQAILKGAGGNIWNFESAVNGKLDEITYKEKDDTINNITQYCNKFGIIACKDESVAKRIIEVLR